MCSFSGRTQRKSRLPEIGESLITRSNHVSSPRSLGISRTGLTERLMALSIRNQFPLSPPLNSGQTTWSLEADRVRYNYRASFPEDKVVQLRDLLVDLTGRAISGGQNKVTLRKLFVAVRAFNRRLRASFSSTTCRSPLWP